VRRYVGVVLVFLVVLLGSVVLAQESVVRGVVFEDANGNRALDPGEQGIPGVPVSNGQEVVVTDATGRYELPVRENMCVFVTKPSGYAFPLSEYNTPLFFYLHRPNGSPEAIREYPGIAPTGPLPQEVNFPLYRVEESEDFSVVVLGDTQVTNHQEIQYLRDSIVADVAERQSSARCAIVLGDNLNDPLNLYPRYLQVMAGMGIPTWYVFGNHDMNFDAPDNAAKHETFSRYLGPTYYSFNIGEVHFVVLDSVMWDGKEYHGEISEEQLLWLEKDLALVPQDALIVLAMHIPLVSYIDRTAEKHQVKNREKLFALLEGRKVLFLAGHTHTIERFFPGDAFGDWSPNLPFPQILVGAACGSWWSGPKDDLGIPLSYTRDGVPKGYFVFEFSRDTWKDTFYPFGISRQMNVSFFSPRPSPTRSLAGFPEGVFTKEELGGIFVLANVFNADSRSEVLCAIDDLPPQPMEHQSLVDPFAARLHAGLPDWMQMKGSTHTYVAPLPEHLKRGLHKVTVTFKDAYGRVFETTKFFEVL
jgi:3',5'-cyclic AMP phosphodiesterase CpdA